MNMIPLSVPLINGNEWEYVKQCLDDGWISSVGGFVDKFEHEIARYAGSKYSVACMNGTVGLQIALLVNNVGVDDYVIAPNLTFVASLNAIKHVGAKPLLFDVDKNTWQLDLDLLETYLTENTVIREGNCYLNNKRIKAIMPVHVLGNMCDIDRLLFIGNKFNISIIEDSTESLGSNFKGKSAGTFGTMGVFSFNGNKIISTGGGGMIITDNEVLAKRAKHLTTQAKSSSTEYIHDEVGFNYRLVNVLAAIGVGQMEQLDRILIAKKYIDTFYRKELSCVGDIEFQQITKYVTPNNWLFTFKTSRMRDLLHYLNSIDIVSRPFWVPMNRLEMFQNDLYVTNTDQSYNLYENCISIPCSAGITQEELVTVVNHIKTFFK